MSSATASACVRNTPSPLLGVLAAGRPILRAARRNRRKKNSPRDANTDAAVPIFQTQADRLLGTMVATQPYCRRATGCGDVEAAMPMPALSEQVVSIDERRRGKRRKARKGKRKLAASTMPRRRTKETKAIFIYATRRHRPRNCSSSR